MTRPNTARRRFTPLALLLAGVAITVGATATAGNAYATPDSAQNPTPPPANTTVGKTGVHRDNGLIYYIKGGDVWAQPVAPPPPPPTPPKG